MRQAAVQNEDIINSRKAPNVDDKTCTNGKPVGHGSKVENDFNQAGERKPTQRNEAQRTANSRHDREAHIGFSNQTQSRRGARGQFATLK